MVESRQNQRFRPTADWPMLRLRAEALRGVREFFAQRGFLEVETPLLATGVVVERHLDPFPVVDDPASGGAAEPRFWLQTSPEAGMKRLLASGGDAIYQVTRSFRRGEKGRLHNPEFTIVEWYRRGDDMRAGMDLLSDFCRALLDTEPADPIPYRDAFRRYAQVDPFEATSDELAAHAAACGLVGPAPTALDRDGWLDLLLVERVQPQLGRRRPVILHDYPASQAALARVRPAPPAVAERFELFVRGVELANGYHELTDPVELARRMDEANADRVAEKREALPHDVHLQAAMNHGLPDSAGVALGFDRLVMLRTGAESIDQVMAFPFDRI